MTKSYGAVWKETFGYTIAFTFVSYVVVIGLLSAVYEAFDSPRFVPLDLVLAAAGGAMWSTLLYGLTCWVVVPVATTVVATVKWAREHD